MNGVWRSLLWKEWREQRLWLAALVTIAILFLLLQLPRGPEAPLWYAYLSMLIIAGPLVSLFLGSHVAASERSQNTMAFLSSLPASVRRAAMAKLLSSLIAIWIPCLVIWLAASFIGIFLGEPADAANFKWMVLGYGCSCSSLMIWMAAAGVNRRDEVQAGAVGLLVTLCYWMVFALASQFDVFEGSFLSKLGIAAGPGGVYSIFELKTHTLPPVLWPLVVAAATMHAALIAVFVSRYGRVAPAARPIAERSSFVAKREWLAPPRRGPLTAMLWKQARESLPLAGLGAAAVLISSICVWLSVRQSAEGPDGEEIIHVTVVVWIMAGVLVSIVAGIGLFIDDLRPELHDFWRSRPIRVDEWLAVKFVPGLLLTLMTLVVPAAVVSALVLWLAPFQGTERADLVAEASVLTAALAGQGAAYCVAAGLMAVIRRPVVAAVMTIAVGVCVLAVVGESEFGTGNRVQRLAEVFGVMGIIGIAAAWVAVRKDWGWRS
jgi:ABC-type transport system involved in multi-copper enzyme maturation permease subunit